ncbi:hypothetical protein BDY19DRAFT_998925 [Irpex rosettiformis]|uniref:Uncharacterized protein n=1 Tax=Irpex rosettiformis TaxID=378272 RepID=A0ACB8TM50_9APHY|nr:hypothetical protein BDY19DRAFT_998925 [Irpex rosettiformis]
MAPFQVLPPKPGAETPLNLLQIIVVGDPSVTGQYSYHDWLRLSITHANDSAVPYSIFCCNSFDLRDTIPLIKAFGDLRKKSTVQQLAKIDELSIRSSCSRLLTKTIIHYGVIRGNGGHELVAAKYPDVYSFIKPPSTYLWKSHSTMADALKYVVLRLREITEIEDDDDDDEGNCAANETNNVSDGVDSIADELLNINFTPLSVPCTPTRSGSRSSSKQMQPPSTPSRAPSTSSRAPPSSSRAPPLLFRAPSTLHRTPSRKLAGHASNPPLTPSRARSTGSNNPSYATVNNDDDQEDPFVNPDVNVKRESNGKGKQSRRCETAAQDSGTEIGASPTVHHMPYINERDLTGRIIATHFAALPQQMKPVPSLGDCIDNFVDDYNYPDTFVLAIYAGYVAASGNFESFVVATSHMIPQREAQYLWRYIAIPADNRRRLRN